MFIGFSRCFAALLDGRATTRPSWAWRARQAAAISWGSATHRGQWRSVCRGPSIEL